MPGFDDLASISPHVVWDGVIARAVEGERATFTVIELAPNTVVPEHAHDNEQVGVLVSGSVSFRIGDDERDLPVGATWSIPPNVPHAVSVGSEGAVVVEVFAPGRADWDALERLEPSPPAWPGDGVPFAQM
jgi:quercetin dioxygenase-like cupin family protein